MDLGVIDTLAAGFQTVAKRPWLILVLVIVDLFLWLGPQLSIAPVVAGYEQAWPDLLARFGAESGQMAGLGAPAPEVWESLKQVNLFGLLAWQTPSLVHLGPNVGTGLPRAIVTIPSIERLVIAAAGLMLVGLVVTSAYNGAIAQYVRGERFDQHMYFDRLGVNWLRLIGFYLLVVCGVLAIGLPVLLLSAAVSLLVPALGTAVMLVFWSALIWVMVFLFFFVMGAIFVADLGPLQAARSSIEVVQRNFWSALGFILLTYLIGAGTVLMWGYVRDVPALFAIAVAGNAFIWSGLTAAAMIFYRDRAKGSQRGRLTAG